MVQFYKVSKLQVTFEVWITKAVTKLKLDIIIYMVFVQQEKEQELERVISKSSIKDLGSSLDGVKHTSVAQVHPVEEPIVEKIQKQDSREISEKEGNCHSFHYYFCVFTGSRNE